MFLIRGDHELIMKTGFGMVHMLIFSDVSNVITIAYE